MISEELKRNTRHQIIDVLIQYSSSRLQHELKRAVPFINVYEELHNRWDSFRIKKTRKWFIELFSDIEFDALKTFDKTFEYQYENCIPNKSWPDLDSYIYSASWNDLRSAAILALKSFKEDELENYYGYDL